MKKITILAFVITICGSYNHCNAQIGDIINAVKKSTEVRKGGATGTVNQNNGNIEVQGNNQVKTFTMDGQKLEIVGNDHIITVNGYASTISLQGTGNKITVNSVKSIDITGVNNKLYYKSSPNKNGRASSSVSGVDNSVIKLK